MSSKRSRPAWSESSSVVGTLLRTGLVGPGMENCLLASHDLQPDPHWTYSFPGLWVAWCKSGSVPITFWSIVRNLSHNSLGFQCPHSLKYSVSVSMSQPNSLQNPEVFQEAPWFLSLVISHEQGFPKSVLTSMHALLLWEVVSSHRNTLASSSSPIWSEHRHQDLGHNQPQLGGPHLSPCWHLVVLELSNTGSMWPALSRKVCCCSWLRMLSPAFVISGSYNRILQIGQLINYRNIFLTVLETGVSKIKVLADSQICWEATFWFTVGSLQVFSGVSLIRH